MKKRPVKTFKPTSADYDSRIFSYREKDQTVSLTTVSGRERVKLILGNYQIGKLKGKNPTSATLSKHRDGQLYIHIQIKETAPTPQKSDQVIGVDLGRRDIAVTSEGQSWSGQSITKVRDRFSKVRASVQQKGTKGAKRLLSWCAFPSCGSRSGVAPLKRLSGKGANRFARNKIRRAIPLIRNRQLSFYIGELSTLEQQALFRRCGGKSITLNWGEWSSNQLKQG